MTTGENAVDRWGQPRTSFAPRQTDSLSTRAIHMSDPVPTLGERMVLHGSTGSTTTG